MRETNCSTGDVPCPSLAPRVPPEYYNRSTWSLERYEQVMQYVWQVLTPQDVAGAYVPYFNLSDDTQVSLAPLVHALRHAVYRCRRCGKG